MARLVPPFPTSYRGVVFELARVTDQTGRLLIEHSYPRRDGVDFEDMGGEAGRYRIEGFVNGLGWADQLRALKAAIETAPLSGTATFIHPFWGPRTGLAKDLQVVHRAEVVDHARFSFSFVEGSSAPRVFSSSSSLASASAAATAAASGVTTAAAGLPA